MVAAVVSEGLSWSLSPLCYCGEDGVVRTAEIGRYPNGDPLVAHRPPCAVVRVLLRPRDMHELMGGLFFIDALRERGQRVPHLILPFPPGSRQDRLNDEGDVLFTAKSVATEVNARLLETVTIVDPHSDVIAALLDRCVVVRQDDFVANDMRQRYGAVISPDGGAEKRAGAIARKLGVPLVHGWKRRSLKDGSLAGFGLEPFDAQDLNEVRVLHDLNEAKALVVDDICDGGGTFLGLSTVLRQRAIRADLLVTHGIFSQGAQRLVDRYETVYTTDSVIGSHLNVEVLPICQLLLGGSLS